MPHLNPSSGHLCREPPWGDRSWPHRSSSAAWWLRKFSAFSILGTTRWQSNTYTKEDKQFQRRHVNTKYQRNDKKKSMQPYRWYIYICDHICILYIHVYPYVPIHANTLPSALSISPLARRSLAKSSTGGPRRWRPRQSHRCRSKSARGSAGTLGKIQNTWPCCHGHQEMDGND